MADPDDITAIRVILNRGPGGTPGPPGPPGVPTPHSRFIEDLGPPVSVSFQIQNSSAVWETMWTYTAST
jgi:hypothetical protein